MPLQFAILLYNIQTNKKEENLDLIKVLILVRIMLKFILLQTFAGVWHFLLAFFMNVLI